MGGQEAQYDCCLQQAAHQLVTPPVWQKAGGTCLWAALNGYSPLGSEHLKIHQSRFLRPVSVSPSVAGRVNQHTEDPDGNSL